jgi:competence protein ComEA
MASFQIDKRWLAVGAAAAALTIGVLLPRPAAAPHQTAIADATVPPQLIARPTSESNANAVGQAPSPGEIAVYVCGAVKNPGVYTFAPGERVVDALKRAGGALPDADIDQINLAEALTDAMKVTVPHKGQVLAAESSTFTDSGPSSSRHRRHSHGGSSRHKLAAGQSLDVNTASAEELVQLPGVGPSLAQRIVDYRQQNGSFQTVDDLQNVPGIGPSKFERLAPFVRL